MKNLKLSFTKLFILMLIVFAFGASPVQGVDYKVDEFVVTNAAVEKYDLDFDCETAVFMQKRNGYWNVYMWDKSTDTISAVYPADTPQHYPAIHDRRIVWSELIDGDWNIVMYDLKTSTRSVVCSAGGVQSFPDIYGDVVVWVDDRNGNWDIYGKNVATGYEFSVCKQGNTQYHPVVHGEIVAWSDLRKVSEWDVYMYNLRTGIVSPVCKDSGNQSHPRTNGKIIIFSQYSSSLSTSDVYAYDILSQTKFKIIGGTGMQIADSIDGNLVSWTDDSQDSDGDIKCKNLDTGEVFIVCDNSSAQHASVLGGGNMILYIDERRDPGVKDLYGADICPEGVDIDDDCEVGLSDILEISSQWLSDDCNSPGWCDGTDLGASGEVDYEDFAAVGPYWLWGPPYEPEDSNSVYIIVDGYDQSEFWMTVGNNVMLYINLAAGNGKNVNSFDLEVHISDPNLGSIDNTAIDPNDPPGTGTARILAEPRDEDLDYWGPGTIQEDGLRVYGENEIYHMSDGKVVSFQYTCNDEGDVELELTNLDQSSTLVLEGITIHGYDPNDLPLPLMGGGGESQSSQMPESSLSSQSLQQEPSDEEMVKILTSMLLELKEHDELYDFIEKLL